MIKPGSTVVTDGYGPFRGVVDAGCTHIAPPGSGPRAADRNVWNPAFKWVNTVLGNIKNAIASTYRAASKHAARRLVEFEYRFNRRFDLAAMIPHIASISV